MYVPDCVSHCAAAINESIGAHGRELQVLVSCHVGGGNESRLLQEQQVLSVTESLLQTLQHLTKNYSELLMSFIKTLGNDIQFRIMTEVPKYPYFCRFMLCREAF